MEIVIDIPDDFIKDCDGNLDCVISIIGYEIDDVCSDEMGYTSFNKYTILPKGHGRLIDADVVDDDIYDLARCMDLNYEQISKIVDNAPTIIEADKESD